jgi:hypothetical protein
MFYLLNRPSISNLCHSGQNMLSDYQNSFFFTGMKGFIKEILPEYP